MTSVTLTPVDMTIRARSYTGQPNAIEVIIGNLTIWKSYDTIIGFEWKGKEIPGIVNHLEKHVVADTYSATTGRHQNHIDGGTQEARLKRIEKSVLDYLLGNLMKTLNIIPKETKLGDY